MIDEEPQAETVSITVGDQVISAYVYSAAHCTEERVFQLIDELYRKAQETPITITRTELVEAVGVSERSISDALSRLRSASRLVSTRHGHKIYYQTITQPHQPELVSVAAISSRPPPAQPPRNHREDAAQPPRNHREDAAQPPRNHREDAAQPPRTHREDAAQIPLVSCPRCGPGSMVPTKIKALQNASLPGTTYYCAGNNRSCSLLWHSTAGVIFEPGQRQLTHDEATVLVQQRLRKPAPTTGGANDQRTPYLDAYRRRFGQLPWETEEGRRLTADVTDRDTDGDDPEPRAPAHAHTLEDRPDGADRIAERPP